MKRDKDMEKFLLIDDHSQCLARVTSGSFAITL